jgi:hypothetical protein
MELDGVGSDAVLAVVDIEEGHSSDYRPAVEAYERGPYGSTGRLESSTGPPHRVFLDRAGRTFAMHVRELEDHLSMRMMRLSDHEMKVVVIL